METVAVSVDSTIIQSYNGGGGLCQCGNVAMAIVKCHYTDVCLCLYVNGGRRMYRVTVLTGCLCPMAVYVNVSLQVP